MGGDDANRMLVLCYSQSGQLTRIVQSIVRPLFKWGALEVVWEELRPAEPFPFPWSFFEFFDVLPESVLMEPPEMKSFSFDAETRFDLILLAYQVWFLSPSLPVTGFLKSPEAKVMKGTPVVTVVNCKDRWLMAQEKVKECIRQAGGILIDNVVFTHQGNALTSLVSTLHWLWTGKKEGFWKIFPSAGVSEEEIRGAERFGRAIRRAFERGEIERKQPVLRGLGAAKVDPDIVYQEPAALRHFNAWARMLSVVGKRGAWRRRPFLLLFALYVSSLILLSVPFSVILRGLIKPLRREALNRKIQYYEGPSGSSIERLESTHSDSGMRCRRDVV